MIDVVGGAIFLILRGGAPFFDDIANINGDTSLPRFFCEFESFVGGTIVVVSGGWASTIVAS